MSWGQGSWPAIRDAPRDSTGFRIGSWAPLQPPRGRGGGRAESHRCERQGEAGAVYVRRAAGGMKGASGGPRPAPGFRAAGRPRPSRGSLSAVVTPGRGCLGAEPGAGGGGAGGGAGGGDVAAGQAGGARRRREVEPPREEGPSELGAAAGGSGKAGSGACPGERPARPPPGSAAELGRGPGSPVRAFCPRGAGSWGPGVAPSGPQPRDLRSVSTPVWVPVPPPRRLPELRVVRSAALFLPVPSGRPDLAGSVAAPPVRLPGRGGLARRLPEVGGGGRGAGQALRGRLVLGRSTILPPKGWESAAMAPLAAH